jgi:hypothetical protein
MRKIGEVNDHAAGKCSSIAMIYRNPGPGKTPTTASE